jgi:hypothetical protein
VIIHTSSERDFGLLPGLVRSFPEDFGVYAFQPLSSSSRHQNLSSLISDQADELLSLAPAGTHLYLLGDCMAGHMSLNMAQHLLMSGPLPCKVILLDSFPIYCYLESSVFELLTLPGEAGQFGPLGSSLQDLDAALKHSEIGPDDWAERLFATMYLYQSYLADGLAKIVGLDLSDATELAAVYLDWTKLVSITLGSPSVCYSGPVIVLASEEQQKYPMQKLWDRVLPDVIVGATETPHFDILMSPVIHTRLTCPGH